MSCIWLRLRPLAARCFNIGTLLFMNVIFMDAFLGTKRQFYVVVLVSR